MSKLVVPIIGMLAIFSAAACRAAVAEIKPDAIWDGDFTEIQEGYSLNRSGNALSEDKSTITIDQDVGVKVDFTTGVDAMTVMFKYSDLSFDAQKTLATSFCSDGDENRTGVYLASGGTANGIWNTADWANPMETLSKSSGVLAFCYSKSAGTSLYYVSNGSRTQIYGKSNLVASGDAAINGCTIGGERAKTGATLLSAATGMKIRAIAIFNRVLSEADMLAYTQKDIEITGNTLFSSINEEIESAGLTTFEDRVLVHIQNGSRVGVDEVLSQNVGFCCAGSITLYNATQGPIASYFGNVDFAGVEGAVKRDWLGELGVVGFNFNANGGRNGQGNTDGAADTALALEIGTWYKNAYSPSGSSTEMFADGLSVLTWQANNVYAETDGLTAGTFIQGYLDDGGNVNIKLSAVPYETYDVIIYCSTDSSSYGFKAKTVNGTIYTWDDTAGEAVTTDNVNATWGLASAAAGKAVYGANTLRINNLTGPLSILGGTNSNNARGCISAIQIMPAGTSTAPEMTVGTAGQMTQANWTDALWNVATVPTSGNVVINVSGDVELTVDETVALSAITVTGTGSLKIIPDQQNNVTFTASSISSAIPLVFANDGIGIATVSASVTYTYTTTSISSSLHGNTYVHGAGSVSETTTNAVAIGHNGGIAVLDGTDGTPFYLQSSDSATATTVIMTNVTANYTTSLGVGAAAYTVAGSSVINAGVNSDNPQSFVLSQGGGSRACTFLLKDTSVVNVAGTSDIDSNQASIMFGHWNGPSTFTIQDSAAFNAVCQVLVGKTSNTQTININGGTFTASGFKVSAGATGTNALNLSGGLLVLGDVGITSYGSTTISVNVLGDSEIRASAATLPISQAVTIAADKVLSFTKDSGVAATVVTLSGAVSGTGGISVGAGVTLNLGTNRPEGEISVDADGTIAVVMANKADLPVLKVASEPANVFLYDTDGETVLSGANVIYDSDAGTITVHPPVNTWNVASDLNFDTAGNWSYGLPQSTQDTAIKVTGDAALTIAGTYEAATLTVSGSGVVEFSGEGSFTVGTLYLNGGATLAPNSKISATSIVLESGTVLRLKDKTESSVISGAGAVETYGNVVFGGSNQFTGGLTVKTGSAASTTTQQGFGKNNYGQAIANLSRIVVEGGGSLDLANTKDACYAITIAGKGIENNGVYSGAIFNSGEAMGSGNRQTASLTLSADAMVKVDSGHGWGIVNSGHAASVLSLGGRTLTVSGSGTFPVVNANTASGTATTGTLFMDGVNLQLTSTACNFAGVNVVVKGCTSVDFASAPSAIGSLTLKPSATGTTATNWNLPSGLVPSLDTSNVDPTGLSVGDVLTLFTAPSATVLTDAISVKAGGRYTTTINGNTVTATVKALANFMHYDFNAATSIATDSTYNFGNLNPTFVNGKNGKAGVFNNLYKPYYDSNTSNESPFYAGEMTVTSLLKVKEASNTILWNIGSTGYDSKTGIALIAKDASTLTVVSWVNNSAGSDVVSVTGVDLLNKWHFVTLVASANGTVLYVDDRSEAVSTCLPSGINARGQFGSIHAGAKSYNAVSGDGFYLDDWRVYDAALTAKEIKALKSELLPDPFFIHLR